MSAHLGTLPSAVLNHTIDKIIQAFYSWRDVRDLLHGEALRAREWLTRNQDDLRIGLISFQQATNFALKFTCC
jgi:hypothetical protein